MLLHGFKDANELFFEAKVLDLLALSLCKLITMALDLYREVTIDACCDDFYSIAHASGNRCTE